MKASLPDFLADVPTSNNEIDQGRLDIENKERSNLFSWNGQFSPQLVEVLLQTYASKNATVLDAFAGSGTVLYECGRGNLKGISSEINPSAFYMTRVYTFINLHPTERNRYLHAFESELSKVLLEGLELWAASRNDGHSRTPRHRLLEFRDGLSTEWEQILADALIVAVNFSQLTGTEQLASAWTKLKLIVEGLPHSDEPLRALNCDARNLPVADDLIDLVITSPPYINVFNYHQQYRASAEALGWDLLTIARSEIGSNRKHRANRFLTVVQYCLDITQVLSELSRVCRPSARVTFVVGRESMVRGVRFFNGEIVGMLASKCTSLRLHFRQERSFRNRFGELIVEDILHFNLMKSRKHSDLFNSVDARRVAQDMLKRSLAGINDSAIEADVRDAIVKIEEVQPSPIFSLDRAKHKPPNN